jgi:membrane protease YdiL (CAAX protease family)
MVVCKENPRNLLTSLLLVFPLFLIYQLGVLFTLPMLNGADFVTVLLFRTFALSLRGYLLVLGAILVVFGISIMALRRRQPFNPGVFLPVLLESTVWALTMGSVIVLVMTKLLGFSPRLAAGIHGQGVLTRLVMSLGAGVYEETVFRLGMLSGLALLFHRAFGMPRWGSILGAFILSSALFSAVHHVPPYGDPFAVEPFTFRFLAGLFFGALYKWRGFAVAVYTHAFYDIFVLVVR